MRILQVNKFYYRRGGDCIVAQQTERLLARHGHEVAVFSMSYPLNDPSPWSGYFAPEVDFAAGRLQAMRRIMGRGDVVPQFQRLLNDFNPQVVHLHNIHSYISPIVAKLAHDYGCRVVWTMHDYKLMCPAYTCMRGEVHCQACFQRKWNVMLHRCLKNSVAASAAAFAEAKKWSRDKLEQWVDAFICPSQYMAQTMRDAGFDEWKVKVLYNCVDTIHCSGQRRGDYYCYASRLTEEKGVERLLDIAARLPMPLKVAGTGPLEKVLREKYAASDHIEFLGHLDADGVAELFRNARFSVMPSLWPENNPLSVIESLCQGTPVVGTNVGGIPELIDNTNGIVVGTQALASALEHAYSRRWNHDMIAQDAQRMFATEAHYDRLMKIYNP